jgi:hypothetical protein
MLEESFRVNVGASSLDLVELGSRLTARKRELQSPKS